ncbi:MAG TPA: hypothetical protein VGK19_04525 [Capsulimonadaceae bacterium]
MSNRDIQGGKPLPYLMSLPDDEGVAATRRLYAEKYGRLLTDEEAAEALRRMMTFIYLTSPHTDEPAPIAKQ